MIIAKTATRNVAFEPGKLAESVFTSQADILTRQIVTEDSSTSNESEANFQDLGYSYNADLYIFNQDDSRATGLSFSLFRSRLDKIYYILFKSRCECVSVSWSFVVCSYKLLLINIYYYYIYYYFTTNSI